MTDKPPRAVISQIRPHTVIIEDQLWMAAHARAEATKTSISKVINEALREHLKEDDHDTGG